MGLKVFRLLRICGRRERIYQIRIFQTNSRYANQVKKGDINGDI
jgi:hypothetical protein